MKISSLLVILGQMMKGATPPSNIHNLWSATAAREACPLLSSPKKGSVLFSFTCRKSEMR